MLLMRRKERTIPTYLGIRGDYKYWATTQSMPAAVMKNSDFASPAYRLNYHLDAISKANKLGPGPYNFIGHEVIDYSALGHDKFNYCSHNRISCDVLPYGYFSGPDNYTIAGCVRTSLTGSPVNDAKHLTTDVTNASIRAWYTMQPRYEQHISMLNFLYELKDVKAMIKTLYSAYNQMLKLVRYRDLLNERQRYSPNNASKSAAEVSLQYNFGLKPLFMDLSSIIVGMNERIMEAQERFKIQGLTDNVQHYSETLADNTVWTRHLYGRPPIYSLGLSYKTEFYATMYYRYSYQLRSYLDAFMQYWGLTGSWESLWNAIPFSFLLDYFIKIGKALKAMRLDSHVKTSDVRYMESIKTIKSSGLHINFPQGEFASSFINGNEGTGLVSGYSHKLYSRKPCSPKIGLFVPKTSRTTDQQKFNMVCLARALM